MSEKNFTDCRDAVFQELFELAKKDSRVVVISADTGAFIFKQWKKELPNQFFNVGISEQNSMSIAAGMAKMGRKPFVFGISNFVTVRCLDQIRVDICGMNMPVTILGTGTGLIYAADGLTHHITEDIGVMRSIPNINIYSPSDHNLLASIVHMAYRDNKPYYIRFDKGPFTPKYDFDSNINEVAYKVFKPTKDVGWAPYIIANGITTDIALEVQKRINVGVIDIIRLKPSPFDGCLYDILNKEASHIITLEEHNIVGGIGAITKEFIAEHAWEDQLMVHSLGIKDKFIYEVGDRDYLRKLNNIDVDSVTDFISKLE